MAEVISAAQLTAFLPALKGPDAWAGPLNAAMERFEINTPPRVAAFLAQVAHESGELARLVENLNYTAARLVAVWPTKFPTVEAAQPYERNPERLANRVYAKRLGNGDTASGDGWRFRGRGLIQLTGRNHLADDQNDDNDDEDFIAITKLINGGTAGLKSRQQYWARARAALA